MKVDKKSLLENLAPIVQKIQGDKESFDKRKAEILAGLVESLDESKYGQRLAKKIREEGIPDRIIVSKDFPFWVKKNLENFCSVQTSLFIHEPKCMYFLWDNVLGVPKNYNSF